jgi:DNA-binding NtrC family response regulator
MYTAGTADMTESDPPAGQVRRRGVDPGGYGMSDNSLAYRESDATVVLVDDEALVLNSLRSFLELETEYNVQSFTEPDEAVAWAGNGGSADVVVSDFLMPGIDGVELLRRFAELQPHAPRILLTGYADKDSALRAINDVGLFQYIEKPWDNANLLIVLRNALARRFLVKQLQEKITEIDAARGELSGLQQDILRTFI